jgi:hypothetical protein
MTIDSKEWADLCAHQRQQDRAKLKNLSRDQLEFAHILMLEALRYVSDSRYGKDRFASHVEHAEYCMNVAEGALYSLGEPECGGTREKSDTLL